jgi:amino-acid N-acetyltransferase
MEASRATAQDMPAIQALLAAASLPLEGTDDAFRTGVVLRDDGGRPVAAAALEPYGDVGLLRSVVVEAGLRGRGSGRRVVAEVEALARTLGVSTLYLLTETAVGIFTRLGYRAVDRVDVPAAIEASREFSALCGETAVAMARRIG